MNTGFKIAAIIALIGAAVMSGFIISQEPAVGTLKGRAVAKETGKPVAGARVYLTTTGKNWWAREYYDTSTDADGRFKFASYPVGEYTLEISGSAHRMKEARVSIKEGRTEFINAKLAPEEPGIDIYVHQNIFVPDERAQVTCKGFVPKADYVKLNVYKADVGRLFTEYNGSLGRMFSAVKKPQANSPVKLAYAIDEKITKRDSEGVFIQRVKLPVLPAGLYIISADAAGKSAANWILITSLGLVAKNDGSRLLAYTVDLKTGRPVQGAKISFYDMSNMLASAVTGPDGIANIESKPKGEEAERRIAAQYGDSYAFVSSWFSSYGNYNKEIYTYTDRPVYRPGQKVYFKGIVRDKDKGLYKMPSPLPITVEVRDSRDTLIYKTEIKTDKFGSYYGAFNLNSEAMTGYYTIVSSVAGREQEESAGFQVMAYKKPEFSVKVRFGKKRYIRGDRVKVKISADYYFGSPVSDAKVKYYVRKSDYWLFEKDNWEDGGPDYYDYGGYGEIVTEGLVKTDKNGQAEFEFRANWPRPKKLSDWDADQEFSVDVYVTDKSNQEADGSGSVVATRGEFAVNVTPDKYVVKPGGRISAQIIAKDYNKKPVRNKELVVTLGREEMNEDELVFKVLWKKKAKTDSSGNVSVNMPVNKAGSLRIIASTYDNRKNEVTGTAWVWSYSDKYGEIKNVDYPDLQVIPDKKMYKAGDTATVLVNTRKPGSTALVTIEADKIYYQQTVQLKDKSTVIKIPVMDAYKPNFYIGVCFVKNKSFVSQEAMAKVSLKMQALNISIKPEKKKYKPKQEAVYKIKATDSNGRPVSAQLSVGVVDEAIYAIAEDNTKPVLDYFYSGRPNNVRTNFSFPQVYLSDPDKAGAPLLKADSIRVRKNFKDTAYWNPNVVTDANGEAVVKFKWPDNLTTWRTTVRGITMDTRCGQAADKVITRQDILVRLEIPRFMVQGDKVVASAAVHNYSGKRQRVRVDFKAPGLDVNGKRSRFINIDNNSIRRLDWEIKAPKTGTFNITAIAAASKMGDAMQLPIPVYPYGMLRQNASSGNIISGGSAAVNLDINKKSILEASVVKVRLAPSLASSMLGSLDYLATYPYGCTEQTASSFIPDVVLSQSLGKIGVRDNLLRAKLPDMVATGLARLYKLQLDDGGWSWCEYGNADPWMTAYVCYGLIKAKEAGFSINQDVLNRGLGKLDEMMRSSKIPVYTWTYGQYVLALSGQDVSAKLSKVAKRRNPDSSTLALAALGLYQLGKPELADEAMHKLAAKVYSDGSAMHWKAGTISDSDDIETTAFVLQAIIRKNPNDPRIPMIIRWLMNTRRDNYWYCTRDTAMALYAMSDYLIASKELTPDYNVRILVNGGEVANLHIGKDSIYSPEKIIDIPAKHLKAGQNSVDIIKNGVGNLYYTVSLNQFVAQKPVPAVETDGLSVTRSYFKIDSRGNEKPISLSARTSGALKVGDVIVVRLKVRSTKNLEHLLLEDNIPAGCEIADRGDIDYYEWDYWYVGRDVRDSKVSFYLDEVPRGISRADYRMRVGFAGDYHAMPAQIFAMYQPDIKASTSDARFKIK